MRLCRTNQVAVLTIIAGGTIGGLLTFGPLAHRSPDDDVAEQVTANARAVVESVVIDVVDVVGNIRQADSTIIAMSGLDQGSAYTISDIQRATRSMWATGQFKDIRVRVEGDVRDGLVTLIWEVDEQPEDPNDRAERILRRRLDEFGVEEPLVQKVEEALARAEDLARAQRDIEEGMDRLAESRGGPGSEAGRRLFERKKAMHEGVADLEQEIVRLTGETRADQREASDRLDDAASTIDDDHLKERVRYSWGLIGIQDREYTMEFEAETTRIVEELVAILGRGSGTG